MMRNIELLEKTLRLLMEKGPRHYHDLLSPAENVADWSVWHAKLRAFAVKDANGDWAAIYLYVNDNALYRFTSGEVAWFTKEHWQPNLSDLVLEYLKKMIDDPELEADALLVAFVKAL